MNDYIRVVFWNTCDTDDQLYQFGWKQWFYVDADLFRPEYEIVRDGGETVDTEFKSNAGTWSKFYPVRFGLVPEYFVDSLQSMAICDNIRLYRKDGTFINIYDVEITLEWINECYADVTVKFLCESLFAACCSNVTLISEPPIRSVCDKIQWWVDHNYDDTNNAYVIITITQIPSIVKNWVIDWGDGNTESFAATGMLNKTHYYTTKAQYRGYVQCTSATFNPNAILFLFGQMVLKDFDIGECYVPEAVQLSPQRCERTKFYIKDTWTSLDFLILAAGSLGYGRLETIYGYENCPLLDDVSLQQQNLDANTVNGMLIHLDTHGLINGKFKIQDGLGWSAGISDLTPAGAAARLSLIAKGWTVTMNA